MPNYTVDQLFQKLERADAAGDTEAAKVIADEIRRVQRAPKSQAQAPKPRKVTDDMSLFERVAAGVGQSFDSAYHGLVDAPAESVNSHLALADRGLRAIGADGAANWVNRNVGAPVARRVAEQRKAEQGRREIDADLMGTGGGKIGAVAGTVAQIAIPGGIATRAARTSRAAGTAAELFLPRTVKGAAVQGATLGAVQPVASEGERLRNAGMGGVAGGVGAGVPRAAGMIARNVTRPLAPIAPWRDDRTLATILRGASTNGDAALMRPQPSAIPGVQRTLAEESLDPGIAQLERTVRARSGGGFDTMRRGNNKARSDALSRFAGDDEAIRVAKTQREQATSGLLQKAYSEARPAIPSALLAGAKIPSGVPVAPIRSKLGSLIAANEGRSAVQASLRDVAKDLDKAGTSVAGLHNVRKTIGDMLEGRVSSDKAYAKAATAELMQVKEAIDQQLRTAAPSFGNYLDDFITQSKPINRMQLGQHLLDTGTGPQRDITTGAYTILPGQFGKQVKDLDWAAQKATGFDKARAADILEPEDFATISAVEDDLGRQVFADTAARGPGSDTFQKLMTEGNVLGAMEAVGVNVPGGGLLRMFGQRGVDRLNQKLMEIMMNPSQARQVLASVPPNERRVLEDLMARSGGLVGASTVPGLK